VRCSTEADGWVDDCASGVVDEVRVCERVDGCDARAWSSSSCVVGRAREGVDEDRRADGGWMKGG